MRHPYFNYPVRYAGDAAVIKEIVRQVGMSDEFILKSKVASLEERIKEFTGAKQAVAVANGTTALTLILKAMGVGPGVDVLTPAFSFISTASTISLLGGRPVFVDVDKETGMMDPEDLERRITDRSKVVIPTHLFSVMANMSRIREVAEQAQMFVLEDSAVALGGWMDGKPAGLMGDAGLYSFFPAKPIGGIGDGGMIVTNNEDLGTTCRMLRNHGQDGKNRFLHHQLGFNHRMDEVVAAYVEYRLKELDDRLQKRRMLAKVYDDCLLDLAPQLRIPPAVSDHRAYYTYVLQAERRDELAVYLKKRGIETVVYYPKPLPLQDAFRYLGYEAQDFPNALSFCQKSLSIPLYPEMSEEDAYSIANEVRSFYEDPGN